MTRTERVLVELFGPVPVAGTIVAGGAALFLRSPEPLGLLPLFVLFGYPIAAIPSLLFTLALELAFSRGLSPASRGAVGLAAFLGLWSGALLSVPFWQPNERGGTLAFFAALGSLTGALVGILVRWRASTRLTTRGAC